MTSSDRFVLLGLARPRAAWFSEVSRWSTSGIVPAEFVKCVSAEELRARLASARPWSAVLLDGSLPPVDRDLIAAARDAACAPIIVDDRDGATRWRDLGAVAVLPSTFDRGALLDVLESVATAVGQASGVPTGGEATIDLRGGGLVVAVCGPGGTGASTAAAAIAQGLASAGRDVVLADLARNAELAALHDVRDVVPSVQELVEAHRSGVPLPDEVRRLTFSVVERGYSLLLGLRRARYWPSLRPRAFAEAFASLQTAFGAVVCDVTADFEGESDAGSRDVEERNLAARTAVAAADAVVVVGRPGVKGVHALVRVLADLAGAGVPAGRVLVAITGAPRSPRARAEIASAIAELARPSVALGSSPLFLPNRPVDAAFRDGAPLPAPLPAKLASAVLAVEAVHGRRGAVASPAEPVRVAPGSLGSFTDPG